MRSKYVPIGIAVFLLINLDALIQRMKFAFSRYIGIGVDILLGSLILYGIYLAGHDNNFSEVRRMIFKAFFYLLLVAFAVIGIMNIFAK